MGDLLGSAKEGLECGGFAGGCQEANWCENPRNKEDAATFLLIAVGREGLGCCRSIIVEGLLKSDELSGCV